MIHLAQLLTGLFIGLVVLSLAPGGAPWPRLVQITLLSLAVEIWYGMICLTLVVWYRGICLGIWFWYRGLILGEQTRWAIYRLTTGLYLWYLNQRLAFLISRQQRQQAQSAR